MARLYPWLSELWQQWQHNLMNHAVSQAMLLHTEKGMGVEQLLEQYIGAVMCKNGIDEACGFCHSCELVKAQHHPDLHWIKPEKAGAGIGVDQIRLANQWAQASSQLNGYRLMIIEPAEAMNESAANALLKSLEEPGANCLYLLVTHQVSKLLPTIISRCQQWHVTEPEEQVVCDWVAQQTNKTLPAYCAHLNHNAPLATLEFINTKKDQDYLKLEAAFISLFGQDFPDVAAVTSLLQPEEVIVKLGWLWQLLIDAQKIQFGLTHPAFVPGAVSLSRVLTYKQLSNVTDSLVDLLHEFDRYRGLNTDLMITNWLFSATEATCS